MAKFKSDLQRSADFRFSGFNPHFFFAKSFSAENQWIVSHPCHRGLTAIHPLVYIRITVS
ncbi:MAG: hypothetical protein R6X10_13810 [Desulfobacterales bacterium]